MTNRPNLVAGDAEGNPLEDTDHLVNGRVPGTGGEGYWTSSDGTLEPTTEDGSVSVGSVDNVDYNEAVGSLPDDGAGNYTVDLSTANLFLHSLSEDTTIEITNATADPAGNSFTLLFEQDGSTQHSLTWPSSVEWTDGSAPADPATDEELEVAFISYDGGMTWKGRESGRAFA